MDKRFGWADWLIVGAGLVLLIGSRLAWWTVEWSGGPATSTDAFEYTVTGIAPLVVLLLVGVLIVTIKTESLPLPVWLIHPGLVMVAVLGVAGLIGIRFFWSGFAETDGVSRGLGLYVAGAAVLLAVVGAVLGLAGLRRPAAVAADDQALDDLADLDETYDGEDDDEDDLVRRFNASVPIAPTARRREPSRQSPTPRQPANRRRPERAAPAPAPRARRRQSGPPLS